MPQTAFTATGAGVKSSVLFLRKHAKKQTERIVALKEKLKERIKSDAKFADTFSGWEKKKDAAIKQIEKAYKDKNPGASRKEILAAVQDERQSIQNEFSEKVNLLRDELSEKYFAARQKELDDYPIFMAIAEDIGYDATGRSTGNNELIEIGNELTRFIQNINKTEL